MLEGEHDAAVTESYLLWLEETAARKVGEGWAQRQRALSQVGISSIDQYSYRLKVVTPPNLMVSLSSAGVPHP